MFEEVPSFAIAHGGEAPIVQDEKIGFGVLLEEAAIGAVPPRWGEVPQEAGQPHVADGGALSARDVDVSVYKAVVNSDGGGLCQWRV